MAKSTPKVFELGKSASSATLPYCLKVLLENLLRNFDGVTVTQEQIDALLNWEPETQVQHEIQFNPARVLMQDFTGVPCVVDLASMREAMCELGGDPKKINPLKSAQMVIDHSVQIDCAGTDDALSKNMALEFTRNKERYSFLKWGQNALANFELVPPGVGIVHQVNLERLAEVVVERDVDPNVQASAETTELFFDTVVGTDSHTTMINSIGVLGWGVGGIEAEAAMLGQPISMLIPQVVGVKLTGTLRDEVYATDLVLWLTNILRNAGVVGKFVEFYGSAVSDLPVPVRSTISNMCPEFGATAAVFAVDEQTLEYLRLTGRTEEQVALIEKYHKLQGTFGVPGDDTRYSAILELDLSTVEPSIAGPRRPQDKVLLKNAALEFAEELEKTAHGEDYNTLRNGDIIIASITSCTNTSNPEVLIGAGLLAKKAVQAGLKVPEYVKTSFAPGSRVATKYLTELGLQKYLDELGFNTVGFGCATCIGNSGPNAEWVDEAVAKNDLAVCAVLSGNRNFEGRINPSVKMNYLASPVLVVAYALAGSMKLDLLKDPLGQREDGSSVFLKDILPSHTEINALISQAVSPGIFVEEYTKVLKGDSNWQTLDAGNSELFDWDEASTYIQKAPYFEGIKSTPDPVADIRGARVLAVLEDSVTTDHISPAGNIAVGSPAAQYLEAHGLTPAQFNSYGSRRGNHQVMARGTFANIRLNNQLLSKFTGAQKRGGWTVFFGEPDERLATTGSTPAYGLDNMNKSVMPIYDAAMRYKGQGTPLLVFAGKEYGTGSSRDWAAKGTSLLGVKAVIAQSFERIHRSNLIGMGVLPLQFLDQDSFESLGLRGDEEFDILGIDALNRGVLLDQVTVSVLHNNPTREGGDRETSASEGSGLGGDFPPRKFNVKLRIDTQTELKYYLNGGILQFVLRNMAGGGAGQLE
jgi:aconitate hydratase